MPLFRKPRPRVLLFDVNETLTEPASVRMRMQAAGADPQLYDLWMASTLRDGMALTLAGAYVDFADAAEAALARLAPEADAAAATEAFSDPQPRDDVGPGLRALAETGIRVVTLTNGTTAATQKVLERAGVGDVVERRLSVDAVERWKPAPETYEYACRECQVAPAEAMLVAAHVWDVAGAKRAGLRACFVDRLARGYPTHLEQPAVTVTSLTELVGELG